MRAIDIPAGRIRVGCAGWSLMSRHKPLFGAGASQLAAYATRFDCVEINSSFYRPHRAATYERWADSVPARFRFSVKLPKLVTHEMRLQGVGKQLDAFATEVAGLGPKLGGVLVQLPPSLELERRRAGAFFTMLRRRFPAARLACEPRHASWFTAQAEDMLRKFDVSRVGADPSPAPGEGTPGGAASWRYWRMHGSPRMYYSEYGEAGLASLAAQLAGAPITGEQWVVFDNTAHAHATTDALRLRELLGPRCAA